MFEADNNEETFEIREKKIEFLRDVAMDIQQNISSLNLIIYKKSLSEDEIIVKQKILLEQLNLVNAQLNELESDDDDVMSFGKLSRSSSCSTLSADLPDFFGNSDEFDFDDFSTPEENSELNCNQIGEKLTQESVSEVMSTESDSKQQNVSSEVENLMFVPYNEKTSQNGNVSLSSESMNSSISTPNESYSPLFASYNGIGKQNSIKGSSDSQFRFEKIKIVQEPSTLEIEESSPHKPDRAFNNRIDKTVALKMETLQLLKDLAILSQIIHSS